MNDDATDLLRRELRDRRAAVTPRERVAAMQALVAQVEQVPEVLTDARIAGYWAVDGELALAAVLGGIRAREQVYCLPVLRPDRTMRFAPWRAGAPVQPNRFGIPEPDVHEDALLDPRDLDVVLVPVVGFDRRGARLGFGGGFYDRTFAFLRDRTTVARPVLVGIAYALQECPRIEQQAWDVRLDYIATERALIDVSGDP